MKGVAFQAHFVSLTNVAPPTAEQGSGPQRKKAVLCQSTTTELILGKAALFTSVLFRSAFPQFLHCQAILTALYRDTALLEDPYFVLYPDSAPASVPYPPSRSQAHAAAVVAGAPNFSAAARLL